MHRSETTSHGVIGENRLADAVESVASVATKGIVETLNCVGTCDTNDCFIGERPKGIVDECRNACGIVGRNLTAKGVVGKGDCRSVIRIDGVGKAAPAVV